MKLSLSLMPFINNSNRCCTTTVNCKLNSCFVPSMSLVVIDVEQYQQEYCRDMKSGRCMDYVIPVSDQLA